MSLNLLQPREGLLLATVAHMPWIFAEMLNQMLNLFEVQHVCALKCSSRVLFNQTAPEKTHNKGTIKLRGLLNTISSQ